MNEFEVRTVEGGIPGTPWFIKTSVFMGILAGRIINELNRDMTANSVMYYVDENRNLEYHFGNWELVFMEDKPKWTLFVYCPNKLETYELDYDVDAAIEVLKLLNE